jgi:hypothetical protein
MSFREFQISWLFLSSPILNKIASIIDADPSILFASPVTGNNRTRRIRKRIINSVKNALEDAIVLLTEVYSHPTNCIQISSPIYYKGKTRAQILAGSTKESMTELYFRCQRATIYDPVTIDDLPFEVIKKCFGYLLPRGRFDLVASSSVRRSWRPAAQELLRTLAFENEERIEASLCGLLLHSLVLGFKSFSIKNLELNARVVGNEYIPTIIRFVAPTLSNLSLTFKPFTTDRSCYFALDAFFRQFIKIKNLSLKFFDFEEDTSYISQSLKDGFSRLKSLILSCSRGNVEMLLRHAPIRGLQTFKFMSTQSWLLLFPFEFDIISSVVMNNRSLSNVMMIAPYDSSNILLKVVECCPNLELFIFHNTENGSLVLKQSNFKNTLPLLKDLDVECGIEEGGDLLNSLNFNSLIIQHIIKPVYKEHALNKPSK